jgi:hypothetical protein
VPVARPDRGEVSLGDVLTAAARLGATADDLAVVAEMLDLTLAAPAAAPRRAPRRLRRPRSRADPVREAPSAPPAAERVAGTPVRARLREVGADGASPPAWLDEVVALDATADGAFGVPPEPPLPRMEARAAVGAVSATAHSGRRLDVPALVRSLARQRPLGRPPVAVERRTAPALQVLVDRGEGMDPYAEDVLFLLATLEDVGGRERLERRTFTGTPLRGVDADALAGETEPWEHPGAGALVITLTDVGGAAVRGAGDRAGGREWAAFAAAVALGDAELRVLTPLGAARAPWLGPFARVIGWDDLGDLVGLRA